MVSRRKERVSTGVTGVGLLGVGATMRHKGVERADHLAQAAGNKPPKLGPFVLRGAQVVRDTPGSGRAKLLYGAGSALGLAGGAALGSAATNSGPKRRRQVVEPASVIKLDDSAKTFLGSGLQGTKDALHSKGKNLTEKKPVGATGINWGVGAGAAAVGAHGTHAMFHRLDSKRALKGIKPSVLRHPATAVAGTALAIGSIPLSNKIVQHHYPEYKVTSFGVKRAKKAPVRPSSKASVLEGRANHGGDARAFRSQLVGKLLGQPKAPGMDREQTIRQVKAKRRKLRTDATNTVLGTAGVGLLAAKHVPNIAAKFPNLEHHALSTAIAGGGVGAVGGVQGYRITHRDLKAQERSLKIAKYERHMQLPYRLNPEPEMLPMRVVAKAAWGTPPVLKPLALKPSYLRTQRGIGGVIKPVRVAQTFGKRDEHQRGVVMASTGGTLGAAGAGASGMLGYRSLSHDKFLKTIKPQEQSAGFWRGMHTGKLHSETGVIRGLHRGLAGAGATALTGAVLVRSGRKKLNQPVIKRDGKARDASTAALASGATAAGLGHGGSQLMDRYSRHFAQSSKDHTLAAQKLRPRLGGIRPDSILPRHSNVELANRGTIKRLKGSIGTQHQAGWHRGVAAQEEHFVDHFNQTSRLVGGLRKPGLVVAGTGAAGLLATRRKSVAKRDTPTPLKTTVSEDDARRLVERHGLKGPLPKTLNREQKMAAYEARYVSAGGHKASAWQHRSNQAEKTRVASVGAASLAGGAWLASRGKNKVSLKLSRKLPRLQHHAENAAVGAATVGGGAELYGAHARRKRSSYASSPSGIAASALRRMQGYTPD